MLFVVVLINVLLWKLYMPVYSIAKHQQQQFIQAGLVRHYRG